MNSKQILDREFLELRAKILQIAASLDRIDRAEGSVDDDPKMERLRTAISILTSDDTGRAAHIQLHFSRDYDDSWQEQFQISARS
jgi:hypothetical protein